MNNFSLLGILFLGGCAVGPNYQQPEITVPASYSQSCEGKEGELAAIGAWWQKFGDPILDRCIQEALAANLDLKNAIEKIHQVRSAYQIEAAELCPKIDLSAEQQQAGISQSLFDSTLLGPPIQSIYKVGFDASWEIDLFGKRRRAKEEAYYTYEAERNEARAVYISLLGEVAATYIQVRGFQEKMALAKRAIALREKELELASTRFRAGLSSAIFPQKAEVELEESQAILPLLEKGYYQNLHRLAVLMGKNPEALYKELSEPGEIPTTTPPISVGLPSELLQRRPDIRKAERTLAATTAGIGVAVAELFPSFSLFGSFGLESNKKSQWFTGKSKSWSLGPSLQWPIVHFGRIRAHIRAKNAEQIQALLTYEQTILLSLEEVENSLITYYKEKTRAHNYTNEVRGREREKELVRDQYESGIASLSTLLEAENALISAENHLVESKQSVGTSFIALYKSLGGDW